MYSPVRLYNYVMSNNKGDKDLNLNLNIDCQQKYTALTYGSKIKKKLILF